MSLATKNRKKSNIIANTKKGVDNNRMVRSRNALSIADADGTLADITAQFNALLAELRENGQVK